MTGVVVQSTLFPSAVEPAFLCRLQSTAISSVYPGLLSTAPIFSTEEDEFLQAGPKDTARQLRPCQAPSPLRIHGPGTHHACGPKDYPLF